MSYKGMTGGLFDGEPLRLTRDPGRDIRAQQIANSLESIITMRTAMADRLWDAIWERTGQQGEPPDGWFESVRDRAWLAQETAKVAREETPDGRSVDACGATKAKVFHDGLMDIARSLLA